MAVALRPAAVETLYPAPAAMEDRDAAQQHALQQELLHLQDKYFVHADDFPGSAVDPGGAPSRRAAEEGATAAGEVFPLGYRLTDSSGNCVNLRERLRHGPLIVAFFRGSWCTLCSIALRHLSRCMPLFKEMYGADLVAISGQLPEHNYSCEAANQLEFPVLCDRGLALSRELGIVYQLTQQEARFYDFICKGGFENVYGEGHNFQLPLPATFVLEQQTGRIGYAFVDQDLTKRSRLLRIEAALQDLLGLGLEPQQAAGASV